LARSPNKNVPSFIVSNNAKHRNEKENAESALRNLERQYTSSQHKLKSVVDQLKQYRLELETKDKELKFQVKKVEKLSGELKEVQTEVEKLRKAQKDQFGTNLQAEYNSTYIHLLEGELSRRLDELNIPDQHSLVLENCDLKTRLSAISKKEAVQREAIELARDRMTETNKLKTELASKKEEELALLQQLKEYRTKNQHLESITGSATQKVLLPAHACTIPQFHAQ
jgi:hypothetical protein